MAMRLLADSGLWSTAARMSPGPLVAVLEVSGAVLSWTVDEVAAGPQITFTDPRRADWLWRVLGEPGHLAVAAALDDPATMGHPFIELAGVDLVAGSTERLRRLAVGHWLRRWWPASDRDGITGLDPALLAAEIGVLTAAAQDFFTDDTLDSDVGELLAPHAVALTAHLQGGDPRIVDLVRMSADLAEEVGVDGIGWPELLAVLADSARTRLAGVAVAAGRADDYALAAGAEQGRAGTDVIATGVGSLQWTAVPPATFDAADGTISWTVAAFDGLAVALIEVAISGPGSAAGIPVQLQSGALSGAGVLDVGGRAVLPLVDTERQPATEAAAWGHRWQATLVSVGADAPGAGESIEVRQRVRRFALARLARPADGAYLAEIVAAESDY
jgi:hypothetical protein